MPNGNSYNPFILRPTSVRGNTTNGVPEGTVLAAERAILRIARFHFRLGRNPTLTGCPKAPPARREGSSVRLVINSFTDRGNSVACFTTRSSTALRGRRPRARGGASDTAYRLFSFPFEAKPHSDGVPEGTVLAAERAILRIACSRFRLGRNPILTECPKAPCSRRSGRYCVSLVFISAWGGTPL